MEGGTLPLRIMVILESRHILRVTIDTKCQRKSEHLDALNAACEKFRFSQVQRRGYVLEMARDLYECHNSASEVPLAVKTSAFQLHSLPIWKRSSGGGLRGAGYLRKCPPPSQKISGVTKGTVTFLTKRAKRPFWPPEFLTGGIYVGTLPPAFCRHWRGTAENPFLWLSGKGAVCHYSCREMFSASKNTKHIDKRLPKCI